MLAVQYEVHDVGEELSVFLHAFLFAHGLCILLHCPYCPQRHVRLVNLAEVYRHRLSCHKLAVAFLCRVHYFLEILLLVDTQGKSRQCNEGVSCPALEPRITGEQIIFRPILLVVELVCRIHEAVEEVVAWCTVVNFLLEKTCQSVSLYFRSGSGEHDAFAFLDVHLEISGHVEVLM